MKRFHSGEPNTVIRIVENVYISLSCGHGIGENLLAGRLAAAFAQLAGGPVDPLIHRSTHADFQTNGALPLARKLHRLAPALAAEVLAHTDLAGLATAQVSGPGFINLTVLPAALNRLLEAMAQDNRLGVPVTDDPEKVIVDYPGPNVAKEMHVCPRVWT